MLEKADRNNSSACPWEGLGIGLEPQGPCGTAERRAERPPEVSERHALETQQPCLARLAGKVFHGPSQSPLAVDVRDCPGMLSLHLLESRAGGSVMFLVTGCTGRSLLQPQPWPRDPEWTSLRFVGAQSCPRVSPSPAPASFLSVLHMCHSGWKQRKSKLLLFVGTGRLSHLCLARVTLAPGALRRQRSVVMKDADRS